MLKSITPDNFPSAFMLNSIKPLETPQDNSHGVEHGVVFQHHLEISKQVPQPLFLQDSLEGTCNWWD